MQRLTWQAYMNKELVRAKPVAHVRIFFKDLAHLCGLVALDVHASQTDRSSRLGCSRTWEGRPVHDMHDRSGWRDRRCCPRQVVEEWGRRFTAADAASIAELYHADAVNHQVVRDPGRGRAAILEMFEQDFATAKMTCIPEVIHEAGDVAILNGDPLGPGDAAFVRDGLIAFQRGYWDKLSFLKLHGLPIE